MNPISLLLSLAALALAADLQIIKTHDVECERRSKKGDIVRMHYRGTLEDGNEFDSSYKRGHPLEFQVGRRQVIKGWDEGLLEMCVGEKRKLIIPSDMAYGDQGMGPIPAKATLIFETELVEIVSKDEL